MKKIMLLALTALMMMGCKEPGTIDTIEGLKIKIVNIDSCEYIERYTYGFNSVYSHKGNCRFCKERRQKELKELIEQIKEEQ